MSRATSANVRKPTEAAPGLSPVGDGYLGQSTLPLTSLMFLVPLIVVYEVGTRWYASDPISHVEQRIVAFNDLQHFFSMFGATGPYMPAAAVVAILLACHVMRRDSWSTARSGVLLGMLVESIMYAVPLVTLGYIVFQHYLLMHPVADDWRRLLVLSIGAGIYEELVFRLILFHVLHIVLVDLLRVPKGRALPVMVVVSAISFSLYHYQLPLFTFSGLTGSEPFEWQSFIFRTLAGIYFGMIFLIRGFGLTAGAHASYDIIIVLWPLVARG
jgi:membrane protease YdiL (CAAX protease family)